MGILVEACAHMERLRQASDIVYLLKSNNTLFHNKPVYKCAISSEVSLEKRITNVCWDSGLEYELVTWAFTGEANAKNVERELLSIGDKPTILSHSGEKLTEYRAYDDQELACVIAILRQAKKSE